MVSNKTAILNGSMVLIETTPPGDSDELNRATPKSTHDPQLIAEILSTFDNMEIDIRPEPLAPVHNIPAADNPALIYLAQKGENSRRVLAAALTLVAAVLTSGHCDLFTMPWHTLRYKHTSAARAWLIQNRKPAIAKRAVSAMRQTLKTAWRMNQLDTESYMRAVDLDPIKVRTVTQAAGRMLSLAERKALLDVCAADPSPAGVRDATIIGIGIYCGLRREEIADLHTNHHQAGNHALRFHGKGTVERIVYLNQGIRNALADWLHLRGTTPGPLFHPINKGGNINHTTISAAAVYRIIQKRGDQAGIAHFTPHDLRRTFISNLLAEGVDIATAQALAGHASADTTAGYDRRGEDAKRDAVDRVNMSWERRY
ncbi:MAG: site-specific integrase [Gammaproteobacteria bacterium]|nr:site-specific integrase [Gammaproteobacteria bacterium]